MLICSRHSLCFLLTLHLLDTLFRGNFLSKGDLPPKGGILKLASPASLTPRLCCKMEMVNVLDKSPSQLRLELPNLQLDAPMGCGYERETRRRWCQVQSALVRGVRGLERHLSSGAGGEGPATRWELHLDSPARAI